MTVITRQMICNFLSRSFFYNNNLSIRNLFITAMLMTQA